MIPMKKMSLDNRWQEGSQLHRWGVLRGKNYLRAVDQEFHSCPEGRRERSLSECPDNDRYFLESGGRLPLLSSHSVLN